MTNLIIFLNKAFYKSPLFPNKKERFPKSETSPIIIN